MERGEDGMYKKLTVSFLFFQFVLTLLGQLLYLHYTVESAEEGFGKKAQRYFDGEGDAPIFCEDDGRFSTLRAMVTVGGKRVWVAGKSSALAVWADGMLPLFSVWMIVSLLSSCFFSRGIYIALQKPLLAIVQGMTAWQGGEMPEIEIYCEDEIGRAGKSIAESLGMMEERRRVSARQMRHELLNPLAALRGAAESMWEETGSDLAHILMQESDRMEETVLAGTGGGSEKKRKKVCRLSDLCSAAVSLCRGMAKKEKRETIFLCRIPSGRGVGDERAWRAAILNLQQNALRHSPKQSKTLLCIFSKDGKAVFLFYNRIENGRKGDASGLVTVRKICRENGGEFWCGRLKNGGYTALLSIPIL